MLELSLSLLVCLLVVRFSLPKEYWRLAGQNAIRLDGSLSAERRKRERIAFRDYLGNIFAPVLLIFLAAFVAATWFFSYVMPSDMLWNAMLNFEWNSNDWRNNLQQVEQQHEHFLESMGMTNEEAREVQRSLWFNWPTMTISLVFCSALAYWGLIRCAAANATSLVAGVQSRRKQYAVMDVRRMQFPETASDSHASSKKETRKVTLGQPSTA